MRAWRACGVAHSPVRGYKSGLHVGVDREMGVTQPQRGSARTEVRDLRNIVDRLDLLMGTSTTTSGEASAQSQLGDAVIDLIERVAALEGEAEELRTLVNHLMTIATWQAKVTATLVGEETAVDDDDDDDDDDANAGLRSRRPDDASRARSGSVEQHAPAQRDHDDSGARHSSPTTTLDEDIDDILGAGQRPSIHDTAPPDFGI